jgi:hypothetical protein
MGQCSPWVTRSNPDLTLSVRDLLYNPVSLDLYYNGACH